MKRRNPGIVFLGYLLFSPLSPASAEYGAGIEAYRKAWAAYATQRFEQAQEWANVSVRADPENVHAHALLGDLAYLRHDLKGAKESWGRALKLRPELTALRGQMAQAEVELDLEGQLEAAQIGSLVVRVPKGAVIARDIILTALQEAMGGLEPFFRYRVQRPLTVLVYPADVFYATTHLPTEVLGLFDGKIRVPESAAGDSKLATVLWHEYAHAVVYDLSHARAPRWLQEGLAQECEGMSSSNSEAPQLIAHSSLPPLKALLGIAERPGEGVVMQAGIFYSASHALVRFLLETRGWDRMRAFLEALGQERTVEEALGAIYGWDVATLEKKWREWYT